jgi:hypothetical protein
VAGAVVGREQILAFRAVAHSLDRRRPIGALGAVVGACGIQDTPPGVADTSLAARLDLDAPIAEHAIAAKELVLTWSMRGAPHLVPRADHALFTIGVCPADDTLDALWGQPEGALVAVEKAMVKALRSGARTKSEVSAAVTASVPEALAPFCRACDVHHPYESVFRAAPLLGRIVLTSTAPVTLTKAKTWLGADAMGKINALRTELLLRYLHCYAPTTPGHFAAWAWISKDDATRRWAAVADQLVKVGKGFVLETDLDALTHAAPPDGVRLLPNKDAFLQARDRDVLFAEPAHRKRVFPHLGGPGVVLHEALPVGTWRGAGKGKRYAVTVEPFGRLPKPVRTLVEAEADRVGRVRGHAEAPVAIA